MSASSPRSCSRLAQLGIDLQKIAFIAGALSVGIGFGLQSIVSNFVSGLILLAERPIRVGDQITVKGDQGKVRRISVRATEIETSDQASLIVPNSELITGIVKNWTHANSWGQIVIRLGVDYASDPEAVRDILNISTSEHPQVVPAPAPVVQLASLGDNALQFEVYAVVSNLANAGPIKSDIHFAILKRFRAAGIKIAFPQREVHMIGDKTSVMPQGVMIVGWRSAFARARASSHLSDMVGGQRAAMRYRLTTPVLSPSRHALALAACAGAPDPRVAGPPTFYASMAGPSAQLDAKAAAAMISDFRRANGSPPVTLDPTLMRMAEEQARAMAARDKMDHNVWPRLRSAHRWIGL